MTDITTGVDEAPEQAATKAPDAVPTEPTDGQGEQVDDGLDALLAEYEVGTEPEPVEAPTDVDGRLQAMERQMEETRQAENERRTKTALDSTVAAIRNDNEALKGLDTYLIEGMLEAEAKRDSRVREAWLQRGTNPEGWKSVETALGKKIAQGLAGQPDPQLTADQEAARLSVRGTSTTPPPAAPMSNDEMSNMTDAEFAAHKNKVARG